MTKSLYAEFTVLTGHEDRVKELVRGLTGAVRNEPGNLLFEPFTLETNPLHYVVFETYADDSAFAAHMATDHSKAFNTELTPLVVGGASALTWLVAAEPLSRSAS
jgi:quinol monooxygenase YgiN